MWVRGSRKGNIFDGKWITLLLRDVEGLLFNPRRRSFPQIRSSNFLDIIEKPIFGLHIFRWKDFDMLNLVMI